jgi:hypothetical protein
MTDWVDDEQVLAALNGAIQELRRQAAAWLTIAPILEAHVYEPRSDGHVWSAFTRWNRGSQALEVAASLRAICDRIENGA